MSVTVRELLCFSPFTLVYVCQNLALLECMNHSKKWSDGQTLKRSITTTRKNDFHSSALTGRQAGGLEEPGFFFWLVYGIKSRTDFSFRTKYSNNKRFEATIFYSNYARRHSTHNALSAFTFQYLFEKHKGEKVRLRFSLCS